MLLCDAPRSVRVVNGYWIDIDSVCHLRADAARHPQSAFEPYLKVKSVDVLPDESSLIEP